MCADPLLLFELELFEKRRLDTSSVTELSEDELRLIDLLEKRRLGEDITSDEIDEIKSLMKRLGPKMKDEMYMIEQEDRGYRRYLAKRRDGGEDLDVDEIFELDFLDRAEDDDLFYEKEIEDFERLRETRDERVSDKKKLYELRSQKASGEKIDENLLFEMELLDKQQKRMHLNAKEAFEIQMIRKSRKGESLSLDETKKLEAIRTTRELLHLDKEALADLLNARAQGDEIDEEQIYELELFIRDRSDDELKSWEQVELDLFKKRRDGGVLTKEEQETLAALKMEREDIALEAENIQQIKSRRDAGELIDGDMLYELELFYRKRIEEKLTEDELKEIQLFETRRAGTELTENELDLLAEMKRKRFYIEAALQADNEDDEDGDWAYIKAQKKRREKGEFLRPQEITELDLLERQKKGETLSPEQLEELENIRQERHAAEHDNDEIQVPKSERPKKKKKRKNRKEKKPKRKKPREKVMRRKKKQPGLVDGDRMASEGTQQTSNAMPYTTEAGPPSIPTTTSGVPAESQGLFGGLFGGTNNKQKELDEEKRRQEQLIKEQLRILQMDNGVEETEREKAKEDERMQGKVAISVGDEGSFSSNSWETDSAYESGSSEALSDESSYDGDSSLESASYITTDNQKAHVEVEDNFILEQGASSESSKTDLSVAQQKSSKLRETQSASDDIDSSINDSTRSFPLHVTTHGDGSEFDALTTASFDSSNVLSTPMDALKPKKAKPLTLSAHLRRKKHEQRMKNEKKQENRYGDDISLGSLGMKSIEEKEEQKMERRDTDLQSEFGGTTDNVAPARPWQTSNFTRRKLQFLGEPTEEESLKNDFFEEHKQLFNRSVFNFNQEKLEEPDREEAKPVVGLSTLVEEGDEEESDEESENEEKEDEEDPEEDSDDELHIRLADSFSTLGLGIDQIEQQTFSLFSADGMESLDSRVKDRENEFNQAWEVIQADQAVAAQMNQRRMNRLRDRAIRREENKDEDGLMDVPRLFLFEGEKIKRRKRSKNKKDRKQLKKLENMLSKEFRRAMRDVFESESEEEYDRTFGEGTGNHEDAHTGRKLRRRDSNDTMDDDSNAHNSNHSDSSGDGKEDEEDDWMKRLREKSMHQEGKEMVNDDNDDNNNINHQGDDARNDNLSRSGSVGSDLDSQASDFSRSRPRPTREGSGVSIGSKDNANMKIRRRGRRARRNKSGEVVGDGIDPADVYAQEVLKKKERTIFTIADLRKEMEEVHKEAANAAFRASFGELAGGNAQEPFPNSTGFNASNKRLSNNPIRRQLQRFNPSKNAAPSGPDVSSLPAMNVNADARQSMGPLQASSNAGNAEEGLLGGKTKQFEAPARTGFLGRGKLGGGGRNTGMGAIQEEEEDEDAFLSSDNHHPFGNNDGPSSSAPSRKPKLSKSTTGFSTRFGFGGGGRSSSAAMNFGANASSVASSANAAASVAAAAGGAAAEPLPLPEMQEDLQQSIGVPSRKGFLGMGSKLAMSMSNGFNFGGMRRRQDASVLGTMLEDDGEFEGGLLQSDG